jgi:hypothetical protein
MKEEIVAKSNGYTKNEQKLSVSRHATGGYSSVH